MCNDGVESSGQSSTQATSTSSEITEKVSDNVWGIFKEMVAKKMESQSQGDSRKVKKQNVQKELSIFCNDSLLEPDKSPTGGRVTAKNTQIS